MGGATNPGGIYHGAEPVLAAIDAGIFSGPLFDALDETRGLIHAHGAPGIVPVLFEIEHEQDAARLNGRSAPVRLHDAEKMLGLANGIGGVAEMVGAPEQSGPRRRGLPGAVISIAIEPRISRFVNDADNSFPFHSLEIDPHQIVMRQVHDAVSGEGRSNERGQEERNANGKKSHRADDNWRREAHKRKREVCGYTIMIRLRTTADRIDDSKGFRGSRAGR